MGKFPYFKECSECVLFKASANLAYVHFRSRQRCLAHRRKTPKGEFSDQSLQAGAPPRRASRFTGQLPGRRAQEAARVFRPLPRLGPKNSHQLVDHHPRSSSRLGHLRKNLEFSAAAPADNVGPPSVGNISVCTNNFYKRELISVRILVRDDFTTCLKFTAKPNKNNFLVVLRYH